MSRDVLGPLVTEPRILRYLQTFDGCPYAMLEGPAGDFLFHYGRRALFHLSPDLASLRCAPELDVPTVPQAWRRVLMDTVLWTVSWLKGFELLHASAVETGAGVVAFVTVSGGGKSTLAAECLRRGAALFCDDILALDESGDAVLAHPGPPVMNLPLAIADGLVGEAQVIERFAAEHWAIVSPSARAAAPLAAIVLVDRAPGRRAQCTAVDATNLTLLPHAVGFPHLPARAARRFALFGTLAATVSVLRLSADPALRPGELLDLVDCRLGLG